MYPGTLALERFLRFIGLNPEKLFMSLLSLHRRFDISQHFHMAVLFRQHSLGNITLFAMAASPLIKLPPPSPEFQMFASFFLGREERTLLTHASKLFLFSYE